MISVHGADWHLLRMHAQAFLITSSFRAHQCQLLWQLHINTSLCTIKLGQKGCNLLFFKINRIFIAISSYLPICCQLTEVFSVKLIEAAATGLHLGNKLEASCPEFLYVSFSPGRNRTAGARKWWGLSSPGKGKTSPVIKRRQRQQRAETPHRLKLWSASG